MFYFLWGHRWRFFVLWNSFKEEDNFDMISELMWGFLQSAASSWLSLIMYAGWTAPGITTLFDAQFRLSCIRTAQILFWNLIGSVPKCFMQRVFLLLLVFYFGTESVFGSGCYYNWCYQLFLMSTIAKKTFPQLLYIKINKFWKFLVLSNF